MRVSPGKLLFPGFQLATIKPQVCGCSCTFLFSLFCASTSTIASPSLQVGGTSHVSAALPSVADGVGGFPGKKVEMEENCLDGGVRIVRKSSLKKGGIHGEGRESRVDKGRVRWLDFQGRELAEIKEFEASDWGDSDDDENNRTCSCVIQ
ncbi:uncharacterized protein LOC116247848 [Nymphaea colorata]|nr:uncharacterized protein LOC116247848 [Nymphaea colorata]